MKILDWERKGNVVRFALGEDTLIDWRGEHWNSIPYEHNAGDVLSGVVEYVDIAFSLDVSVLEARDDFNYHGNSPFSKEDFKNRKAPILIIDSTGEERWYSECVNNKKLFRVYMGDKFEDIPWHLLTPIGIFRM